MEEKLLFKQNRKIVGIFIVLFTGLYLVLSTVFAQDVTKTAGTGIKYNKDYLSYGDIWTFDSNVYNASNYSKKGSQVKYYTEVDASTDSTSNKTAATSQSYYASVKTDGYNGLLEPNSVPMPLHALSSFVAGTVSQDSVPSPADNALMIPVMTTTNTNNAVRYSVVPDTTGDYYVYAYSEIGMPTVNYAMLDSCEASIQYNDAKGVPSIPLAFEEVGNNWYRAPIKVKNVRWNAIELKCEQKRGETGENTNVEAAGRQDNINMSLGGSSTTYNNYNIWSTTDVNYNTVLVFQFSASVKLGPITKTGDALTITNSDTAKGDVTAYTVFGEKIDIGKKITMYHCPLIISGKPKGEYMLNEVKIEEGNGQMNALGENYSYLFEDTSVISISWTKIINLPSILVVSDTSNVKMNFFGAKTAEITHPAGKDRTYTFTADFNGVSDLESLKYSYKFNGVENGSGTLTSSNDSFSFSNICYDSVVVDFTATDKDGNTFNAVCTIILSKVDDSAPFKVGDTYYCTWEKAVKAAASGNNKTVVLNTNYTLPNSLHSNGMVQDGTYVTESDGKINYRLPSGVTFVAPYKEGATTVNNASHDHPYANESQITAHGEESVAVTNNVYLTMTVSSNVFINLESNSTMAVGGSTNGACVIYNKTGATHSNICLEENAEICVKSGARLSSCGYIYGDGTVRAESGSTVYMPFSILDFRGGSYTVAAGPTNYGISKHPSGEKGISPFLRYLMNAIQTKLIISQGATVIGYLNLAASGENHNTNATIIGSSAGLIQMENATIEITYDPNTYVSAYSTVGKTKIKIYGNAKFGSLKMKVSISMISATIDTSQVNFPLPYNYDIEIASGTFTVPNNIMILPGASVTVDEEANLNVNTNLTIYDGLHDYTSSGTSGDSNVALGGWENGSGSNPESTYTNKVNSGSLYPSTVVLQSATFGGSGSADLIVNGTLNLNSGCTIAGIIQTGGANACIIADSGIKTSTTTQIGAVGTNSVFTQTSYFAGATVRTLTGEILDTGTGKRMAILEGKTYYSSVGAGNIQSYTYTLYYDSKPSSTVLTDNVCCILQGSWYNYKVNVHKVKDGKILETIEMHFAHGADVSQYYTNAACTTHASTVTENTNELYFDIGSAEAKIVWASGDEENYYISVRDAVKAAVHKGDRIVQLKDLTDFSSVIGAAEGQDFIFDMNGKTINYRSTLFTSIGGKMTIDMNGGIITNVINGKHYDSPVLFLCNPNYSLELLLKGGTISITGDDANPLVNSGVENAGNLSIDLGGGNWEYKTGLVIKTKTDPDKPATTHNINPLSSYKSKTMFNNTGKLTIKDSVGGGKITTNLIQSDTAFGNTAAKNSYTSVIRNNAGAELLLGGGNFLLEIPSDNEGKPIKNNTTNQMPVSIYSAVVLNFGEIRSCDEGTPLSMQGSGSYALYNFIGGTVDLDLRGGTITLTPYKEGIGVNPAMYNGKSAIVNDGVMTLRNSTANRGKVLLDISTTSGYCYGIRNSTQTNGSIISTLTLDGVDIETTQTLNNNSYALYNSNGSTIVSIKNTNVKAVLGVALNGAGSAAIPSKIGDITDSTFISGTTEEQVGTNAFYTAFTTIGNITGSTFKNESSKNKQLVAFRIEGNVTSPVTVGDITDSHFEGSDYGFYAACARIGDIKNSTFTSGSNYALNAISGSIIKSISGGSFKSSASGGLNLSNLAAAATNKAIAGCVGDIINVEFDVYTIGICATGTQANTFGAAIGPEIGDIKECTFHTNTGNGMTISGIAANTSGTAAAPTIGNITGSTFDTGAYGISIAGAAGNATFPDHAFATVGDITDNTVNSATIGIYLTYANAGKIEACEMTSKKLGNSSGVIHMVSRSSVEHIKDTNITIEETSTSTSAAGIYTSAATIGDIIHCNITASKGYAISHNATAALGVSKIGDITNCTIVSGASGINAASGAAIATAVAAAPVIGNITNTTFDTVTYGINIAGTAANAYGTAAAPTVGKITNCTINAGTYGIQIAGAAGNTAFPNHTFATVGDITDTTVNSGIYSIYLNYCKGGIIENCKLNAVSPANNSWVLGNANGSEIKYIKDTPITVTVPVAKSYGIYNVGSKIGLIENSPINAPYGIYNQNVRGNTHTAEGGATIMFPGHIGIIKNTDITVAQMAIANRGVIDEIIGKCTFTAANPSAQVPWDHGNIAKSNAAANTVYNYNTWWGTELIWKQTDETIDGHLTRTVEYKWGDEYRPTIGKISGDIKIIAENTGNSQNNGVAMLNNGVINEISGNVIIETYVHPKNDGSTDSAAPAYSSYALQNTNSGRIDKISGNVKISAGAYAIQNMTGQLYVKTVTTYAGETVSSGQETSINRKCFYDYIGIGGITGDKNGTGIVIEATLNNFALENHARIGNITGKVSITADKGSYAIQNTTGTTVNVEYTYTWPELSENNTKTYHEKYLMASIGTIGSSDSEILIRSANIANNTYTLQNTGHIEAIINANIETTVGYNSMPTILNAEGSYTVRDYTNTNCGFNQAKSWYDTMVTRDYVYERPTIGEIRGVTVTTPKNYALRNAGDIGSITNSSFTAGTGYGIDNTLSYAPTDGETYSRHAVQYYHDTSPFTAKTQYFGETNIWFTRKQAEIGEIDNITITVNDGSFGIQNAGIINSITNSNITVSGNDAIGNIVKAITGEDVSKMENYIYLNDAGVYVATAAASITDKVCTYGLPTINFIGEGNTIQAVAKTVENKGIISEIGSETGKRTTITATSQKGTNQQAIFNYDGFASKEVRENSTTTVYTYAGATIGTIKNISVSNGITPAIQNGSGTANYYPVIGEIAEGTEVTSADNVAILNHATNAQIEKITGGIFTTDSKNSTIYALQNNSTTYAIELSGGLFKSAVGDRDHAVYQPDVKTRYTYPEDKLLSVKTKDAAFADGSTISDYYFITENKVYIIFNGNGALEGSMDQVEISLSNPDLLVKLPKNNFSWTDYLFQGWSKDQYANEGTLDDEWTGSVSALREILDEDIQPGEKIIMFAVWKPNEIKTCQIVWGEMNFTYTRPHYIWNANETKYEQTNLGEIGWSVVDNSNMITISAENEYTAMLNFIPNEGHDSLKMLFTDENGQSLENGTFTVPTNGKAIIYTMLDGKPNNTSAEKVGVGTVTVKLTPSDNP